MQMCVRRWSSHTGLMPLMHQVRFLSTLVDGKMLSCDDSA